MRASHTLYIVGLNSYQEIPCSIAAAFRSHRSLCVIAVGDWLAGGVDCTGRFIPVVRIAGVNSAWGTQRIAIPQA